MKGFWCFTICALFHACGPNSEQTKAISGEKTVYELLDATRTGIDFANTLSYDNEFNVYLYRNYYNGGGVAIGDVNNDGLPDIYFTANQQPNRLYLNLGNFEFKDITEQAQVGGNKPWSTGVVMVDINADGYLDIYVCNSGDLNGENKHNELFINNGPSGSMGEVTFTEKAAEYNLDDQGFSTHASFFDYDKDGDLDAYILNNSYKAIGGFDLKLNQRNKRDALGGDKLMENQNGKFIDVSEKAGIYGSVIGFGLGVTVGDVNNDGWEDIYVSNDFFERDYLYINNKDGTFSEELEKQIEATSVASMGADMADIDNDGYNDIFVTEMLPSDYQRLKSVTTFENWNKYRLNLNSGYYHQFTRNTFQLNNGNNSFSEIGRLSGVEASDWSWGALIFDMDNDGLKDLFIANGAYKDLTDQDYLQYISNEEILRSMISEDSINYAKLIDIIPSNKVENHAYRNLGDLNFEDFETSGLKTPSFSNGSAYGDLDNDGDLDLVVNNLNMESFVYRNTTNEETEKSYLKFSLHGENGNTYAIGSKIEIEPFGISVENQPVRGFQSSMDVRPNVGLPTSDPVSVKVTWPSGKVTQLAKVGVNQTLVLSEKDAIDPKETTPSEEKQLFVRMDPKFDFVHRENRFVDFDRDRLLNHMCSTEGPKMSMADVNQDGYNDFLIGGAKGQAATLIFGGKNGMRPQATSVFEESSGSEDMASLFFDADNDGDQDLYICSGGVEFSQFAPAFVDRLYFNDGSGNFSLSDQKLPTGATVHSTSTVVASDIDGDGDQDLFVGERIVPLKHGVPCSGFILENDGKGNFTDSTQKYAPDLSGIGMITDALFEDLDGDGDDDLIIVGEFMGIEILLNENGFLSKYAENGLADYKGWWNTIHPADLDGDGDTDFVVGNHGLNSRFSASAEHPITLFSKDFDGNGFIDPILAFKAENGKNYPYALRHDLIDQMKGLAKRFPDYKSFKNASISDIFSPEELQGAQQLTANMLASVVLINEGNLMFRVEKLPIEAQFSTVYAVATEDFDQDGDQDIVLGGNLYGVKPEVGRYDATYGVYLENLGEMRFQSHKGGNGFAIKGEIRDIVSDGSLLYVARNNDSLAIFKY
ncbi:VCBS repeat-containing protein [Flavobacteriaceae bacterium TP-CH-4]|uniref:VCBS repeat-containing protein n=1 Tax=Pelagihabitans pacificus TaxID=2696054 RepID=A0A967B231_9FLAO|nr:VCBS repeat-containing protein [Pelagihabitans pacificus]NHF60656.1 VCBS repeat-containing protein [Pelagihabitans pacificus]